MRRRYIGRRYYKKRKFKNLSFRQLRKRGYRISKYGDKDKDGVPNYRDCRPLNKRKHSFFGSLFGKRKVLGEYGTREEAEKAKLTYQKKYPEKKLTITEKTKWW